MIRRIAALLVFFAALSFARTVFAGAPPGQPATAAGNAAATMAAPAPGPAAAHFDAEAATTAYMNQLSPEARAKSDAYFEGGYWLILWDFLIGLVVAGIFLGTGLSVRIRNWAQRVTRFKFLQTALYACIYIFTTSVIMLPWNAWEGYFREHSYGMSNQTMSAWLIEQAQGLGIALVFGTLVIAAIYAVVRKAPRTWWLWGSMVLIAFAVFSSAIAPVYLEPIFNRFQPLAASPLKAEILSLARAQGIPATDVYEFDASRQTKRISAHVSGLFGTTQISLNDNLLTRGTPGEIKAVLGHEMGHYVLNHATKGIVFAGIIIVCGFAFIRWSFEKVRTGLGAGWGIRDITDPAGLPLVFALFSVFGLLLTPIQNTITRTMEAEADNYGVNAARQPDGMAQAAIHLSEYRKMVPGPVEEWILYDHPSGWNRIHRAMVWKAEHAGDADIVAYDAAHQAAPGVAGR